MSNICLNNSACFSRSSGSIWLPPPPPPSCLATSEISFPAAKPFSLIRLSLTAQTNDILLSITDAISATPFFNIFLSSSPNSLNSSDDSISRISVRITLPFTFSDDSILVFKTVICFSRFCFESFFCCSFFSSKYLSRSSFSEFMLLSCCAKRSLINEASRKSDFLNPSLKLFKPAIKLPEYLSGKSDTIFSMSTILSSRSFIIPSPVLANILLTPDEILSSFTILNKPMSPVFYTCVPPQNSTLKLSSIITILTLLPYFSPKNFFTFGISFASSIGISSSVSTFILSLILEFTKSSIS